MSWTENSVAHLVKITTRTIFAILLKLGFNLLRKRGVSLSSAYYLRPQLWRDKALLFTQHEVNLGKDKVDESED